MKIDVRKLKTSGKSTETFEFSFVPESNLLEYVDAFISGAVNVNVTVELHADTVYCYGEASCAIVGKCVRCLEQATANYKEEFSFTFVRFNPGEDEFVYTSGMVDLTPAVTEFLVTTLPTQLYCKSDCKGLCPKCGVNLNQEQCKCKN